MFVWLNGLFIYVLLRGDVFSPLFFYKVCVRNVVVGGSQLFAKKVFYVIYLYFSHIEAKKLNLDLMLNTHM